MSLRVLIVDDSSAMRAFVRAALEVDGSVEKRPGTTAALRDGRHKLIRSTVHESSALFDLDADPGETRDLQAEARATHDELAAELDQAQARPAAAPAASSTVERPQEATQERLRALGYIVPE